MSKFFFVVTIIMGFLAILVGIVGFSAANGAPQEAAVAAACAAVVIVPYCLAKSFRSFGDSAKRSEVVDELKHLRKILESPVRRDPIAPASSDIADNLVETIGAPEGRAAKQ